MKEYPNKEWNGEIIIKLSFISSGLVEGELTFRSVCFLKKGEFFQRFMFNNKRRGEVEVLPCKNVSTIDCNTNGGINDMLNDGIPSSGEMYFLFRFLI